MALRWLLLVLLFPGVAAACGILRVSDAEGQPLPAGETPRPGELAIGYQRVEVAIDNQLAITRVRQQFKNPGRRTLAGEYRFELPADASVSDFAIWDGATRVPGVMQRREAARQAYDAARAQGQVAGLVEQEAGNAFGAHVTPIPPGADKKIELEYRELLALDGGLVRYRFPLVRADGSKPALDELVITVQLTDGAEIEAAWSPLPAVAVHHHDRNKVSISYELSKQEPGRDFELFFKIKAPAEGLRYRAQRADDGAGTLMLSLYPPADGLPRRAKDVVFVVDTSGSMQGKKMRQARRALAYCLTALGPEDRFNIVRFSTDQDAFAPGLVPAMGADLERARKYVESLTESGGTNIDGGLTAALATFGAASAVPRYVVLITDGEPTVGVTETPEILAHAKALNAGGARIFTFGVDEAAGSKLLAELARVHRGESIAVRGSDDLDARLPVFFGKLTRPLFEDVQVAFTGAKIQSVHPRALPHFYLGRQLVMLARYPEPGTAQATVTAKMDGKAVSWTRELALPSRAADAPGLVRAWARQEADFLIGGRDPASLPAEVREEIVRLSLAHTFVTPFTSFLATPARVRAVREESEADASLNKGVGSIQDEDARRDAPKVAQDEAPAPAAAPADTFDSEEVAIEPAAPAAPRAPTAGARSRQASSGMLAPPPARAESARAESARRAANAFAEPAAEGGAAPAQSASDDLALEDPVPAPSPPAAEKAGAFKAKRLDTSDLKESFETKKSLSGLQKLTDGKAQLSVGDKIELNVTKTEPKREDDFNNRLQRSRAWINELAAKNVPLGRLSTMPKLIQTLYYSNPVQASRKLDQLFADLKRLEAAAPPEVLPSTAALAPFTFPAPPAPPAVDGMDGTWRTLRSEVAALRALVRVLRARVANLELARAGKTAAELRPVVETITVDPPLVQGGSAARISLAVRYPAGARPSISWRAPEGSLATARDGAAVWWAPPVPGAYTLTVTLIGPKGQRWDEEVEVEVYQPGNITFSPAHLDERLFHLTHALDQLRREHADLKTRLDALKAAPAPPGGLVSQLSTPAPRLAAITPGANGAAATLRAERVAGQEPRFAATGGHVAPAGSGGAQVEGTWIAPRTGESEWHVLTAEWAGAGDFHWIVSLPVQDAPAPAR